MGLSTGVIKHGHHQLDSGGGDTQRCLEAGAVQAVYATKDRFWRFDTRGLAAEGHFRQPEELTNLMTDRVLIEGFKHQGSWPRILVERRGVGPVEISLSDLSAIVTDEPVIPGLPSFAHNAIESIAGFVDRIATK